MTKEIKEKTKATVKYTALGMTCFTVVVVAWVARTYRQSKSPPSCGYRPIDF